MLEIIKYFQLFKNKKNKICIISEKSFELYATSLGIVLSNNTWIPISQTSPLERIFEISQSLKPDLFILDNINTLKMLRLKKFLKNKIDILLFDEIKQAKPLKEFPKINFNKKDISMIFHIWIYRKI